MSDMRSDDRMRDAFQELRADTAQPEGVPAFEAMLATAHERARAEPALEVLRGGRSEPHAPTRIVRVGGWVAAAAAAAVATIILVDRAPSGDDEFERLVAAYSSQRLGGDWASPTSGLLEVPGMDLMRSLPSIGAPLRGIDPRTLPPRPSVEEGNP